MKYVLFADEYGGDGYDTTATLCEGTYEECQKEQERLTSLCCLQYWNYEIVSEAKINGIR
jgi:hypothetical protein